MGFFRQEYWSGVPFPPPGDLPNLGIKPTSPAFPELPLDSLPLSHQGTPTQNTCWKRKENRRRCETIKEKGLIKRLLGTSLVVSTPCFHCRRCRLDPRHRIKILHVTWHGKKKKKKKKDKKIKWGRVTYSLQVYIPKKLRGIISEIRIYLKYLRPMTATYDIQLWQRNQSIRLNSSENR